MKYPIRKQVLILSLFCFIFGCQKPETTVFKSPGTFKATIDGVNWEPEQYGATYFPKLKRLHITALGGNGQLRSGVELDRTSPIKTYILESHGNHAAQFYLNSEPFNSDHNVAGAGGSFQLLKLDTVAKKASAVLNFTGYSADRKKIIFTTQAITEIEVKIDITAPRLNDASCTINGVVVTNWQTSEVWGYIDCVSNFVNKTMRVELPSVIGGFGTSRHLLFHVPLNLPKGTYPIRPDYPPYSYCGRLDVTCQYVINDQKKTYYPTIGSFTINSIDTAARKLSASFQIIVKDSTRQELIQITNGQLNLNSW